MKSKVVPVFNEYHTMKTNGLVKVWLHVFLSWTLDGEELSALRHGRFAPGERASGSHLIEGRMVSRAGLDAVAKRKMSLSLPGIELQSSSL
jgi:hypothetical protein